MALFVKQKLFCSICSKEFLSDFRSWGGHVCGRECHNEFEWRRVLFTMGKDYYPHPKKETDPS